MTKERLKELLAGVANGDTAPAFISDLNDEVTELIESLDAVNGEVEKYKERIQTLTETNNKLLVEKVLRSEREVEEDPPEKTPEEELNDFITEMSEYLKEK